MAEAKPREGWIDAARGIAIVLVVLGHAIHIAAKKSPQQSPEINLLADLLYTFHVPVFFFLAGMFFKAPTDGTAAVKQLRQRMQRLLWPYLIWSIVQTLLENIIQYGTIRPADMLQIIWFPRAHFWFLYVLFLCSAVALAVNIIAASERRARIMMILLAASWHAIFPWLPSGPIKDIGMNLPYFVLGWLLTSHKSGISSCWRTTLMAWSAFLAAAIPAVIYGLETSVMLRLPLGILGITATCLTAMQISAWKPIIYTGRNSMAIYVIHVLAIYALFMLIKIPSTPGAAGAATLVGVVGPLVFREICKRLHLTRMLGI